MIQLANYEERTFYVVLGQIVHSCDVKFIFQMTEEEFDVTLTPVSSTERATKFAFTATGYPEGQYIVQFLETGKPAGAINVLATTSAFVTGNPIFATSQYNTYNDDGTSTTYVPSDDQGLVPSVSQKLRVSTVDLGTDVSYVRYLKVTNGTLTDNGDNSVTINTSGVDTLEALTDVYLENLENNQIIQYQGFSLPGSPAGWKNQDLDLSALSDTKGIPTEGQFLKYTGGFWQPSAAVGVSTLDDLTDVTITTPISGNVLTYNSNFGWINQNPPQPSPPPSTTDALPEGTTNLYYTEARVSANTDVAANTAKVGITTQQAADILNNNAKVGITTAQADAIVANTAKNSYPTADATKLAGIETGATANQTDAYLLSRANHTGTQTAATISDFDTEVSNNSSVVANTAKRSYPIADENKLAGIAAGAEVNVQSDWNATSGDALILNKPSLFSGSYTDLTNKPSIPSEIGDLSDVPATMGTTGQVLAVNSAGTALEYVNQSGGGGGGTPLASADQVLTGDRLIDTNGYNLEIELDPTGTADTFTIHDGTHDLFEVNTNTSGTLFSVNDVSGLPTFQSNDDGSAVMPKILTAAPTGTATEGTMQLAIISGTSYLYVYINSAWRRTTLA